MASVHHVCWSGHSCALHVLRSSQLIRFWDNFKVASYLCLGNTLRYIPSKGTKVVPNPNLRGTCGAQLQSDMLATDLSKVQLKDLPGSQVLWQMKTSSSSQLEQSSLPKEQIYYQYSYAGLFQMVYNYRLDVQLLPLQWTCEQESKGTEITINICMHDGTSN